MKILRIVSLITLISSYALLVYIHTIDISQVEEKNILQNTVWFIGVISFISIIVYAIKANVSNTLLSSLGFSGLIWFYPFWISTSFGLIAVCLFFLEALYILLLKEKSNN